jgi:hypothetical protein
MNPFMKFVFSFTDGKSAVSVVKLFRAKKFLATLSALVVVAGMLFGARVAVADSVWVQSYQRASSTEACVAQAGETPWQAAWGSDSSWSPSWEQWANKGAGGWTCTRSITWADTPAAASSGGGGSVTYRVGDVGPGGGTIFYVDMARAAGSQFWEVGSDLGTAEWGCGGTGIAGTGTDIGDGKDNTTAIMTGCVTSGIAARVASAPAGLYPDWFLPSKDELNQLCKYARTQSTAVADKAVVCNNTGTLRGGFASVVYWSSSQNLLSDAWGQFLGNGSQYYGYTKASTQRVRPVRAF